MVVGSGMYINLVNDTTPWLAKQDLNQPVFFFFFFFVVAVSEK